MATTTALKPTKAARATAPDLFGQPAYYNDGNHHQALIDQLKALGLHPAAWALEDLLAKVDEAEERAEGVETLTEELDEANKEITKLEEERDTLQAFFDDVVRAFEESPGSGYWPAAAPGDSDLVNAITEQLQRDTATAAG